EGVALAVGTVGVPNGGIICSLKNLHVPWYFGSTEKRPLRSASCENGMIPILFSRRLVPCRIPALITRCSNNYGPYQFPEKLIPLFITNLLRDEPVPVYGDGLNIRDWLHVRDHCAAIHRVWRAGRVGEVYNIGGRCERTNLDLTSTLLDILGKSRSLIRRVPDRLGHDRRYAIDCSKMERELGWRPTVSFETGLRETVAWYCEHTDWMSAILSGEYREYDVLGSLAQRRHLECAATSSGTGFAVN
ncbi:MAG: GDP-mannose 4,6-dehydratase, partial [Planctomycetes bacterium]|nr:GDP-mannose 4,6-dehydratase [Planctomycetota bacterium]